MAANSRLTTAVHALAWLELARREGREPLSSEQVAASLASDPTLVRRLLGPLRTAGLLRTGRGPGAGWSLACPAEDITLADVHDALESPPPFALHAHEPNQRCPVGFGIRPALRDVFAEVEDAVAAQLRRTTVASLLDTLLVEHPLTAGADDGRRPRPGRRWRGPASHRLGLPYLERTDALCTHEFSPPPA